MICCVIPISRIFEEECALSLSEATSLFREIESRLDSTFPIKTFRYLSFVWALPISRRLIASQLRALVAVGLPRAHVVNGVLLVGFPGVLDLKGRQAVESVPQVPKVEPVHHNNARQDMDRQIESNLSHARICYGLKLALWTRATLVGVRRQKCQKISWGSSSPG